MSNSKVIVLLLLSPAVATAVVSSAGAANWELSPSITVTETYTDNVDLDLAFAESDFVTQVSPQVLLTGAGPRLNTSINYTPNYFYYPGSDDKHDLRHSLNAGLNTELAEDLFFVDANASISQRFIDRRSAVTSRDVSRTDNRRTVQSYSLSPYLAHAFGSWATAQLRYTFRHVRTNRDDVPAELEPFIGNSQVHTGAFTVNSGRKFTRLGWGLELSRSEEERENRQNYKSTLGRVNLSYQLTDILALLGSAGYQKRDTGGSFARFDGFIWDVGFRLVPGPRTSFSFRYGNQYDGDTYSVSGHYKITSRDTINLSYTDEIKTFQSFTLDDELDSEFDPGLGSGFLSDALTRRKRWSLSVNGTRGRTSYGISAFHYNSESETSSLDEERYGGTFSLNRSLSPRLSVGSSVTYNLSRFETIAQNDQFWSASANASYQISKSLVGTLEYAHTERDQARFDRLNRGSNYVSLSIRAAL